MKNYLVPFLGTALFLIACGDEVTNISENGGADTVTSFKDLGKCEKSTIGKFIYVSDSVKVYACTDDGWVAVTGTAVNGKNGSNGSDGEKGDKGDKGDDGDSCEGVQNKDGSVTIKCGGKKIGTISNGDDGAQGPAGESCEGVQNDDGSVTISCGGKEVGTITNGNDGAQGPAGESCKGVKNKDGSVTIKCGGKEVGTITNGNDGAPGTSCEGALNKNGSVTIKCGGKEIGTISNGNDGENGASCKIASDKDGVVQLQCGEGENATTTKLYKAMCGTQPYDPETMFCVNGAPFYKCGGKTYDTETLFCYEAEGETYAKCSGSAYDVSKKFCANGELKDLCNGEKYDVTKKFCANGEPKDLCGGADYDVSEKFCYDGKTYDLCGGGDYNPTTQNCVGGKPVTFAEACGSVYFNPTESKFCAEFENKDNHEKIYQVYKYVKIAPEGTDYSETWLAENLRYEPLEGSSCFDGTSNCDKYGRHYTWEAAKEACPVGWHLPTSDEWNALLAAVKGKDGAGYALKSNRETSGTVSWVDDAGQSAYGNDTYFFTALPVGACNENLEYDGLGYFASFWTTIVYVGENVEKPFYVTLKGSNDSMEGLEQREGLKDSRLSVRCIKDESAE